MKTEAERKLFKEILIKRFFEPRHQNQKLKSEYNLLPGLKLSKMAG